MNAITPALSATLSLQPQQNNMNPKAELKMEEKPSVATGNENSSVTLSDEALAQSRQQTGLNPEQTVQQAIAPETQGIEANEVSSGITYATNLQNNTSFFSVKDLASDV
ncbi:MAG: hypothetical protein ACQEQR_05505 [Pseudomonadota bacterium]